MTENRPSAELPRNRTTEAAHKRETFWQIYFPIAAALVAVVAFSVLVATTAWKGGGGASARAWADVSLVLLLLQVMIVILPVLVSATVMAVAVQYLLRQAPPYFKIAQDFSARIAVEVRRGVGYVSEPVLQFKAAVAGFDRFVKAVQGFLGRR